MNDLNDLESELNGFYGSPYVTGRSASVVHIENNKMLPVILAVVCIICGCATAVSLFCYFQMTQNEVETRMLEYYVMENDHKLVSAGIIKAEESWSKRKSKEKQ